MKKKWIIGIVVIILLISLLPFPQKVYRTFYGVNTENGEMVDITLDMTYLKFLFLNNKMSGTITVSTDTETFSYGELLHYTGQSHSENNAGDYAHDFSGWYYNDTMYMKDYENGVKSPSPVGMESVMVHISSDFNKILILHNTSGERVSRKKSRYIGSVTQDRLEEAKKYFLGYYD